MMGYAPQQAAWGQQPGQQAATDNTIGQASGMTVTGCTHATVGVIARGSYALEGENHGRRTYKRDAQVNGLDVMVYFWDERDGPGFCGWWFGPKVGGDQVWAYHPDKAAATPPKTGWKVPYDGAVDPTLVITPAGSGGAAAQQRPAGLLQPAQQQQPMQQQQQLQQQQQQQQQQQGWSQGQTGWGQQAARPGVTGMQNMRSNQMEEQKKRLEENRAKLEEANKKRIEDQQNKMAQLKAQQQAIAERAVAARQEKEQEVINKRKEQMASLAIRRVIQKMKFATPLNVVDLKKELTDILEKEIENCFSIKETVQGEADAALEMANKRIAQIEEVKRKQEEQKLEAETKKKEAQEKSASLAKELAGMIVGVEGFMKVLVAEAEPLVTGSDLTLEQVNSALAACDSASGAADEKVKACQDFNKENVNAMKIPPLKKEGEEIPTHASLLAKINEVRLKLEKEKSTLKTCKSKALKRAEAKSQLSTLKSVFKKYDKDNDGMLSKKELLAYAKGEFSFTVPAADADTICKVLIDGKKGVPLDCFMRAKILVGVAREKQRDTKRKEARENKEKDVVKKQAALKIKAEEATKTASEAAEATAAMEKQTTPLMSKVKQLKSQEMGPLADEVQGLVDKAKASAASAKSVLEAMTQEPDEQVKACVAKESAQLKARTSTFDQKIAAAEKSIASFRAEFSKKDRQELDGFRAAAIKAIRFYQQTKEAKTEDVYKAFDKKNKGKVMESEFSAFFKAAYSLESDDHDKPAELKPEDMSRLFKSMDEDDEAKLSKDAVMGLVRCYVQVTKETVITNALSIKEGKPVRRLELKEICEVLEGPVKDQGHDVFRIRVKVLKDDLDGWVTPVGNQGTTFLQEKEGGLTMKVVKETILTPSFALFGEEAKDQSRKLKESNKKLKVGEQLSILQWMQKEEASGLMRMKVKTKVGGNVGWATAVGSSGAVFLEIA